MNQLTLKITKRCGCSKQYSIMLENKNILYQNDIFALNTLENSSEIDLDNSNIKNYPINLISKYEVFGGLERSGNEIQLEIDEFFGQKKYENNIYDEINKYNSLYKKNYLEDKKKIVDIYMKINEHFYTFFHSDKSIEDRTDFIYSNDFERLFIGEISKDKYKKTLLINLNEIKAFEKFEKGIGKHYLVYLKIIYQNDQKEEILMCKDNKLYLEKFVLLLNGKLNEMK